MDTNIITREDDLTTQNDVEMLANSLKNELRSRVRQIDAILLLNRDGIVGNLRALQALDVVQRPI